MSPQLFAMSDDPVVALRHESVVGQFPTRRLYMQKGTERLSFADNVASNPASVQPHAAPTWRRDVERHMNESAHLGN